MTAMLESGVDSNAFCTMWEVCFIHQADVWFRTWPCIPTKGRGSVDERHGVELTGCMAYL